MRVSAWPGAKDHWHSVAHIQSDSYIVEGLYPIFVWERLGGASSREHKLWQFVATSGQMCALADSAGNVRLCPPEPSRHTFLTWPWTRPMPFWAITAPYGPVAIVLAAPILVVVGTVLIAKTRRGLIHTTRYARLLRHRNSRCVYCGYDLRFSPGRCPECGSPKPAASDFRRLEKARGLLCIAWKISRRVVSFIIAPNTFLAAASVCAAFAIDWIAFTAIDAWRVAPHWNHSYWHWILAEDLAAVARWTAAACFLLWCQRRRLSRNASAVAAVPLTPGSITALNTRDEFRTQ